MAIAVPFAMVVLWAKIASKNADAVTWGSDIYALLGMVLIAIALGIAAIAQPAWRERATDHAQFVTSELWLIFAALVLIHGSLAFLLERAAPGTNIDTYTFQRDACKSLLQGNDPYGATQANIFDSFHTEVFFGPGMVVNGRVQVGFQYPPLTLLWVVPGYLLGDVRYSYILAVIISAALSFAISPDKGGLGIVSVLLLSPATFLVENRCWTEPLVLMMLSATVYAAVRKRSWLPVALGLFLATKQYNFLALPFIGCFVWPFQWKAYWKLAGLSLAIGAATLLPFAIWNFRGLWHDLVLFHLAQPFRPDAVSFAVLFPFMLKLGPALLVAFMAWAIRVGMRNSAQFAAAYGVALLLLVSTSKQAFANYYFLVGQAFLLAVAALCGSSMKSTGRRSAQIEGASTPTE
jgi:hypothetical protein